VVSFFLALPPISYIHTSSPITPATQATLLILLDLIILIILGGRLCEQEEEAELTAKVKRAEAERRKIENRLEARLKELDSLRQQMEKERSGHQESERGFSPFRTRIIHFFLFVLEERELVCSVFILMHKVF
jgi:hypothetical protein